MIMATLALLISMQQPQARPEPRTRAAPTLPASVTNPRTPSDSTVAAIVTIANRVARVRSGLGQLRRVAFNGPASALPQRAEMLRQRCRDLEAAAREQGRVMCRSCLSPSGQAAADQYRLGLGPLGALGRRCSAALQPLATSTTPIAPDRASGTVRQLGNRIVLGLRVYEADLERVRVAFGWITERVAEPRRH